MRLRSLIALSTLLAFALTAIGLPATARAAGTPDAATLAAARAEYQTGEKAYQAGDFVTAIKNWKRARAIAPAALLDYNIGLAYEKLDRFKAAAKYYGLYLAEAPGAPNQAEVEDRLAACEATSESAPAAAAGVATPAVVAPPGPPPGASPAVPSPTPPPTSAAPAPSPSPSPAVVPPVDVLSVPPPSASSAPPPPPPGAPGGAAVASPAEPSAEAGPAEEAGEGQPGPEQPEPEPVYHHWYFWAVLGGGLLVVLVSAAHDSNHAPLAGAAGAQPGIPLFSF